MTNNAKKEGKMSNQISNQMILNIEQARNWAHAGDVEKMSMHLDYAKKGCDAENIASENIAKMIEIVEKCGKAISFHHKLLDDANDRFAGKANEKEMDHALMALKYAKFGLLDMMEIQIEKACSAAQKKEVCSELDIVQVYANKIACYRDLITAIVLGVKNKERKNKELAINFLESAKAFAEKSGIDVKEHITMIEKFVENN